MYFLWQNAKKQAIGGVNTDSLSCRMVAVRRVAGSHGDAPHPGPFGSFHTGDGVLDDDTPLRQGEVEIEQSSGRLRAMTC